MRRRAKSMTRKQSLLSVVLLLLTACIAFDLNGVLYGKSTEDFTGTWITEPYRLFYSAQDQRRDVSWDESTVAIVRSDTEGLKNPVDPDLIGRDLEYEEIEEMVRMAIELTGGIGKVIEPEDELVLIKPNLVEARPHKSGTSTDYRVVKALIKVIHETYPHIEIVVADGPGSWIDGVFSHYDHKATVVSDGLQRLGYVEMMDSIAHDSELSNLKISLVDLNVPIDDVVEVEVPGGGWYQDRYYIHKLIIEADKIISVPVLKIHNTRITVGIKNNVGIAPGIVYGWSKNGLDHEPAVIDKVIVDLARIADVDYVVVDGITALERAKSDRPNQGLKLSRNMIIAGQDIVSVDSVAARLMGFNPYDISHITMAAMSGLGINDLNRINIVGDTIEKAQYYFQKNITPSFNGRSSEGQSCRFWIVNASHDVENDIQGEQPMPVLALKMESMH
jgi:uncharacterized protein (DUF362 family)